MSAPKRVLSVFSLVMINVIAVDSLRTLPLSAKLGMTVIFYYLVAAIAFFIPVALVAAELATAYPETGGIYVWVREAFGRRAAFITIWLQWIYNVVWYPTILAFIAATLAYLLNPALANQKIFLLTTIITLFWLFTLLNCFGMKVSSLLSIVGASLGTLLPMIGIISLGAIWIFQGRNIEAEHYSLASFFPNFSNIGNLALFSAVLFSLLGIEMSAVHAEEVKNPQRDYPRALLYSTIIIFFTLVLGSLAIVIVVPDTQLSTVSGLIDAYAIFFREYHMAWMTPLTAILIVLGGLAGVSAWIIGPTKGLLVAARDKCINPVFARTNSYGAPVFILIIQAVIFTLLSTIFILVDTINAAYWILSDMSAQLALLVYLFMFAAAIKLRYRKPQHFGAYKIPGGRIGMWVVAGIGILCTTFAILIGFVPPTQIHINNILFFESFLIGGLVIFVLVPWLFTKHLSDIDKQ